MVKIPELTKDGQNWYLYRAKLLKVTATQGWLCMLAGEPFNRTYDWQGYDALLHELFNYTVQINIYVQLRCNIAHQVFKYLTKHFRDSEPIPHANEFQQAGTAAVVETPENYPTSMNTATERHASAEQNKEDLSNTTQDPHMSTEAPAMGTSAKCIKTTPVVLEGTPHELQTEPQNSLGEGDGVDSMTSSSHVNLNQVEEVLLAIESQYMHQGRRMLGCDLPVSSEPPIRPEEHPNGLVTWCR